MSDEIPTPEEAAVERADRVRQGLRDIIHDGGLLLGLKDHAFNAIREIDDLLESYLAACHDNDRLRALLATRERASAGQAAPAERPADRPEQHVSDKS